jgi:hypothetical protein
MDKPFPFFFGTNGSGTTLHRAIFDSHPELAIPGEARFVVKLAQRHRAAEGGPFDTGRLVADLSKDSRFKNWGFTSDDVRTALAERPADFPDAIRRLYALYAAKQGKSRYGDKTQANIHHLPLIAELFPEARFVHAVRDGRDVALAHTDGTRIEELAISWKRRVGEAREAGRALGPGRYLESHFEDLVDDTETAVRRICEFIELDFDPAMLTYYERADAIVSTTAVPDRHKDIFLPPTKGLRDWRRELDDGQIARFEALAGDLLSEMGYERKFARSPFTHTVSAWGRLGVYGARYMARRFRRG